MPSDWKAFGKLRKKSLSERGSTAETPHKFIISHPHMRCKYFKGKINIFSLFNKNFLLFFAKLSIEIPKKL